MSVITAVEAVMFLSKVSWIVVSKKRREYLAEKKRREEDKEKELERKVEELHAKANSLDFSDDPVHKGTRFLFLRLLLESHGAHAALERLQHLGGDLWKKATSTVHHGVDRVRFSFHERRFHSDSLAFNRR